MLYKAKYNFITLILALGMLLLTITTLTAKTLPNTEPKEGPAGSKPTNIAFAKPLYLVENEPIPSFFDTEMLYETNNEVSRYTLEALAIPIIMHDRLLIMTGGGYMNDVWYSDRLNGGYLSFFAAGSFTQIIYFRTYQSIGIFGQWDPQYNLAWKYFQFTEIGLNLNRKLAIDLGCVALTKFTDNVILPTIGITYSLSHLIIDLAAPYYLSFRYLVTPKLHMILKTEIMDRSYQNRRYIYDFESINGSIQMEFNLFPMIWLKSSFGYQWSLYYRKNQSELDYPNSFTIMIGLEART